MVNRTRQLAITIMVLSCLFALAGMAFGYFIALPAALQFLTGFAGDYIEASLTASSYLNFVTAYSLGLAILFQIPLILLLINAVSGPLKPSKLLSFEPYVLLGAVIVAAIITPTPDIMNQAIVAGPIILMYQVGIGMVMLHNRTQVSGKPQPAARFVAPAVQPKPAAAIVPKAAKPVMSAPAPRSKRPARPAMDGFTATTRPRRPQSVTRPAPRTTRPQPLRPARSIDGCGPPRRQASDIAGNKP